MWRKARIVRFVFCVLLGLQVIFLTKYVSTRGRKAATLDPLLRTTAYNNVDSFLSACFSARKQVFLLDPNVFHKQINNSVDTINCKYLCTKQPVTVFGTLGELWKEEKGLIQVLKQQFTVLNYGEGDPRLLSIDSPVATSKIPTHYFFSKLNHTVHLVVLYERKNKYWWHGAVANDSNTRTELRNIGVHWQDLSVGQHAGAFDKMGLSEVTIDGQQLHVLSSPKAFVNQLPDSRFIECNYTRAQNFYSLYPPDRSPKALKFKTIASETLSAAMEVLEGLNATYWLHGGTDLGWFRQCDIFPHSLDIDLGMWIRDYSEMLPAAFKAKGLFLMYMFGKVSDSLELSFNNKLIKLDLFFFYEAENHIWNGGVLASTGLKYKYLYPKITLCWTEFLEHRVQVPCDTLAYIRANYGDKWFEPIKKWSWRNSPPNVQENGYWPKAERPSVIKVFKI